MWLGIARAHGVPAVAIVVRTAVEVCHRRNDARPATRRVPADVVDAMWARVNAVTDEGLRAEGFAVVRTVGGEESMSTRPVEKARRGDLAVIETRKWSPAGRGADGYVTEYEITSVTSVTQTGQVKAVRTVMCEAPVPLARWHGLQQVLVVPNWRVDVEAVLVAARAHTWPGHPNQPKAFESLEAVRAVMREHERAHPVAPAVKVPAPVPATRAEGAT